MVGDSAYSISEQMMKPFSEREITKEADAAVRRRKVLFNRKPWYFMELHGIA